MKPSEFFGEEAGEAYSAAMDCLHRFARLSGGLGIDVAKHFADQTQRYDETVRKKRADALSDLAQQDGKLLP